MSLDEAIHSRLSKIESNTAIRGQAKGNAFPPEKKRKAREIKSNQIKSNNPFSEKKDFLRRPFQSLKNLRKKRNRGKKERKKKMPKCKPVLWPRSNFWSTHRREFNGLLLSQKNEVSEMYGSGGSLNTAIYRVVVVDESGVPLLQITAAGNESDANADLAWAKDFAKPESKWKSSSKLANAFISSWNKSFKQVSIFNFCNHVYSHELYFSNRKASRTSGRRQS